MSDERWECPWCHVKALNAEVLRLRAEQADAVPNMRATWRNLQDKLTSLKTANAELTENNLGLQKDVNALEGEIKQLRAENSSLFKTLDEEGQAHCRTTEERDELRAKLEEERSNGKGIDNERIRDDEALANDAIRCGGVWADGESTHEFAARILREQKADIERLVDRRITELEARLANACAERNEKDKFVSELRSRLKEVEKERDANAQAAIDLAELRRLRVLGRSWTHEEDAEWCRILQVKCCTGPDATEHVCQATKALAEREATIEDQKRRLDSARAGLQQALGVIGDGR